MNDIINWIALNNTLMIRIGFSAVVLLLVVYAFRFFFMPSISVVATESSKSDSTKDQDINIEELAELQGEIDTLKAKLKELQNAESKPAVAAASAAPAAAAAAPSSGGLETVSAEAPVAEASVNESAAKELKEKIKTLEARLSEYEIIAEEIAEIGKLRVENLKLKEMLASAPATITVEEPASEPVADEVAPETAVSDSEIDALLGSVEENTAADAENPLAAEDAAADAALGGVSVEGEGEEAIAVTGADLAPEKELFIIHSEVEVTEEEKEIINSFEQFKKV